MVFREEGETASRDEVTPGVSGEEQEVAPEEEPAPSFASGDSFGPAADDPPQEDAPEVRASPVARRLADDLGIDLSEVEGTGPGGRITRDDVLNFEPAPAVEDEAPEADAAPEPAAAIPLPGQSGDTYAEVRPTAVEAEQPPYEQPTAPEESAEKEEAEPAVEMFGEVGQPAEEEEAEAEPAVELFGEVDQPAEDKAEAEPALELFGEVDQPAEDKAEAEPALELFGEVEEPVEEAEVDAEPVDMPSAEAEEPPDDGLPTEEAEESIDEVGDEPRLPFYVSTDIDMGRALELLEEIDSQVGGEGVHVTAGDLTVKACIEALKGFPGLNGGQSNGEIDVGIAFSTDDGLVVQAITDCGDLRLSEIAAAARDLADRAGNGSPERSGSALAIRDLGELDVTGFAATVQSPQTAVLAIGAVTKRPVVKDDGVTVGETMTATLSADQGVVDGAEGARFLVEVKRLLENPVALLV